MVDVIVVGAGPAGSMAALRLARAGARVLIVDRASFPRDTLCGDRLGSAALSFLRSHHLDPCLALPAQVVPLHGWRVHAPVAGTRTFHDQAPVAVALRRRVFDQWLLEAAIQAGARFEAGWHARGPLLDAAGGLVRGVVIRQQNAAADVRLPALMVIAADGRDSTLARELGLRVPGRVRCCVAGGYASGIHALDGLGEIHLTGTAYLGVTPVGVREAKVWAVGRDQARWAPETLLQHFVSHLPGPEPRLSLLPGGLAPVGVGDDSTAVGVAGLLLAGDAIGCPGPIVSDGVYRAMLGGQLAAEEALRAIESGDFVGAVPRLAAARRQRFSRPWPFRLRESRGFFPWGMWAVGAAGRVSPRVLKWFVRQAAWID